MENSILFLQFFTGLFFFTTGARKTFIPKVRSGVFGLFTSKGVPMAAGWAVVLGEMMGGASLVLGILPALSAPLLLPIMFGAFFLDTLPTVRANKRPATLSAWVSNLLCTPEAQLIITLSGITLYYWS